MAIFCVGKQEVGEPSHRPLNPINKRRRFSPRTPTPSFIEEEEEEEDRGTPPLDAYSPEYIPFFSIETRRRRTPRRRRYSPTPSPERDHPTSPEYNNTLQTLNNSPQTSHQYLPFSSTETRRGRYSPTPSPQRDHPSSPEYNNTLQTLNYSPQSSNYSAYTHDDEDSEDDLDGILIRSRRTPSPEPYDLDVINSPVNDVPEVVADDVLTLSDPDVLDCTICCDPLTIPVFQCMNGHIACSSCSTKVRNKCPSCALPIGHNRCRAIEKVIESVKTSCRNFKYGCMERTSYCMKNEHEISCTYAPCSCPQLNCPFIGSLNKVSAHFISGHPSIAKRFLFDSTFQIVINPDQKSIILQENGGMLFILNNREFQSVGNVIFVSCINPSTSKDEFLYKVAAKKDGFVVKLESVADNVAWRDENSDLKRFLMVPRDFIDSCGKFKVEVSILNLLTSPKGY